MSGLEPAESQMKRVDRAFFIEGGAAVVTLVSNRIEAHDLTGDAAGTLTASLRWQAKMTHAIHVVEAPDTGVVICTDTSGRHMALEARTGAERWRTTRSGEGHAGIVVPDLTGTGTGGEMFVYVTWTGAMQWLDPVTGAAMGKPEGFEFGIRHLRQDTEGRMWVIRSDRYQDGQKATRALARLTLAPPDLTDVVRLDDDDAACVTQDGGRVLTAGLQVPDPAVGEGRFERWRVLAVPGGETLASRDFAPEQFGRFGMQLSPDGRHALGVIGTRALVLDMETLATVAELACGVGRVPAFHPGGRHLLVCDGTCTRIVPIAAA